MMFRGTGKKCQNLQFISCPSNRQEHSVTKIYQDLIHRLTLTPHIHILGLLITPLHPHTDKEKRGTPPSEGQMTEPRLTLPQWSQGLESIHKEIVD